MMRQYRCVYLFRIGGGKIGDISVWAFHCIPVFFCFFLTTYPVLLFARLHDNPTCHPIRNARFVQDRRPAKNCTFLSHSCPVDSPIFH